MGWRLIFERTSSTAKCPGIPQRYLDAYGTAEEREAELKAQRDRRRRARNDAIGRMVLEAEPKDWSPSPQSDP